MLDTLAAASSRPEVHGYLSRRAASAVLRARAVVSLSWDGDPVVDRYAVSDDVRLHYIERGSGPLVILLHGIPEFWYAWRHQIIALSKAGFRAVAPDLRGYNLSDKPRSPRAYTADHLTHDVAEVIRSCGEKRAFVVGQSWGGLVAWLFAMHYPEFVDRLVIMNTPHPSRWIRALRTRRYLRNNWQMVFFQLPWVPEAALRVRKYAPLQEAFLRNLRPNASSQQDIERYAKAIAEPGAVTGMLNHYRAFLRQNPFRLGWDLRVVEAPVLVIWGQRDRYFDAALAEPDEAWVPHARVERVPDAGHWVHLDAPDRVSDLLLRFVRA